MTPGGERGTAGRLPLWGDMADDAKHMKRRPVTLCCRCPYFLRRNGHGPAGRLSVALARLSAAFAGISTGSGSRGKKKGRLPDGSGPQRDRTRPRHTQGGARHLACCSMRARELRGPCGATRAAGTMLTAPGRGTSETLPEILRPWPRWPRPRPRRSENSLCQFTQAALSRPQSRQRQGRVTVAAGQRRGKKSPASGCPSAGPPDRKRHPTTFDQEQFHECR